MWQSEQDIRYDIYIVAVEEGAEERVADDPHDHIDPTGRRSDRGRGGAARPAPPWTHDPHTHVWDVPQKY